MERYGEYKNSGVEWIGDIPEHWTIKKLSSTFKFATGFTPSTGNAEFYENGDIDWVTISDLGQKYIYWSDSKITTKAVEGKQIIPKGSLMYSFKLSVGKVAFAGKDIFSNEAIFSIFPDNDLCLDYYYYLLPQILIYNANENIYGAKLLNQEIIKSSKLVIPPFKEQLQIAKYLDYKTAQIDKLISDKEKLIELLNEERTAIINQAVTKGVHPNVPMKDSGIGWLGEIPAHWMIVKFTMFISIRHGHQFMNYDFTESGIKIVKITQLSKDGYLDLSKCSFISESRLDNFDEIIIKEKDILMCLTGGTIGKIVRVGAVDEPLLQNYRVGHFSSANQAILKDDFIFWLMSSNVIISQIFYQMRETGQPNIGMEDFNKMRIAIPPLSEQLNIVEHITENIGKIDSIKQIIEREIELLKEYKTALISEVVTGKVDVRNEVIAESSTLATAL